MRLSRLKHPALAGLLAAAGAVSSLHGGSAQAALNCTLAAPAACYLQIGNMKMSNLTYSGDGVEGADTLLIDLSQAGNYIFSFSAANSGSFDSNASISFDLTTLNGATFLNATSNSNMSLDAAQGGFVFSSAATGMSPGVITSSGSFSTTGNFASGLDSTSITLSWGSNGQVAQNSTLYIKLTSPPPVPGPLPVFGGAAALAFSRRLRNRLQRAA